MTAEAVSAAQGTPRIWESFLWGLLSAVSLNIGSVVGVTCLPRRKVRAMLMSFGGGALLFALSIELFGHVLRRSEEDKETAPVWIMEGSAVIGGCIFALLNKALNAHGADVRKPSTTKGRFVRLRALLMRRLAGRLMKIPFFAELTLTEVKELITSAMNKERFRTGDIIISHETRDSGVFFIVSGMVRLFIAEQTGDGSFPPTPHAVRSPLEVDAYNWRPPQPHLPELPEERMQLQQQHQHHQHQNQLLSVPPAFAAKATPAPTTASPQHAPDGHFHTWDLGPDMLFGDMAVLTGMHMGVTAVALESTKVLVLPCHEVMHLIERNERVRQHVSLQALVNLKQLEAFRTAPEGAMRHLLEVCTLVTFQPGETVFEGTVAEATAILSIIMGVVEVTYHHDRSRMVVHGSSLLCTEHFRGQECQAFAAIAVEATSVLVIRRCDLDHAAVELLATGSRSPDSECHQNKDDDGTLRVRFGESFASPAATIVAVPTKALVSEGRRRSWSKDQPRSVQVMPVVPSRSLVQADVGKDGGGAVAAGALLPGQVGEDRQTPVSGAPAADRVQALVTESESNSWAHIGHNMGWEPEGDSEAEQDRSLLLGSETTLEDIPGLVTDQDLEEREQDIAELHAEKALVRSNSKGSSAKGSDTPQTATKHKDEVEDSHHAPGPGGAHAAVMVWLGILIDAIPESLVIGILINKAGSESGGASSSAEAALPFVIGVFLSNLPESMSSSGSMKAHGIQVRNILLMWWTITFLTAVGACMGALLFPPGSTDDYATGVAVSGVEGLAAGAMLTMIAQTMLPEAFEQGGDVVGLSCLAGFLCALSVKLMPFSGDDGH